MASTTDMNIVIGQGNAIKEVHNVRKQSLELNQQFVPQKIGIEEEEQGDKRDKKNFGDDQRDSKEKQSGEESDQPEGSLIDIKV
jgi:hypothetical protein